MYVPRGKHAGRRLDWVVSNDRRYAEWCACRPQLGRLSYGFRLAIGRADRINKANRIDHDLSADLIGGVTVSPGLCHRNAIAVLRAHPELKNRLQYVEGFCSAGADGGSITTGGQHSWLMLDDVIIEVTPAYNGATVEDYFPVLFWKWSTAAGKRGDRSGLLWTTSNRQLLPAMRSAMQRARSINS